MEKINFDYLTSFIKDDSILVLSSVIEQFIIVSTDILIYILKMSCNCCPCYNKKSTITGCGFKYIFQPQIPIKSRKISLIKSNIFVKFGLQYTPSETKEMYQRLILLEPQYNYLNKVLDIYLKFANEYAKIINTKTNGYSIFIIHLLTYNKRNKLFTNYSLMFLKYKYVQGNEVVVDVDANKNKMINNMMSILNGNTNNIKVYSILDFIIYPVEGLRTLQNYVKFDVQLLSFNNPPNNNEIIFDVDPKYIENPNVFKIFVADNNNKDYCATYRFITNPKDYNGLMIKTDDNNDLYGAVNGSGDPCVNVYNSSLEALGNFIYNTVRSGDFMYLYYYDLSSIPFEYKSNGVKIKQLPTDINQPTHINFLNKDLRNYPNIYNGL